MHSAFSEFTLEDIYVTPTGTLQKSHRYNFKSAQQLVYRDM